MSSAVMALDGHTYERQAIESWFGAHGTISPVTGARMESRLLVPNHALRAIIRMAGGSLGGLSLAAAQANDVPRGVLDFVFEAVGGRSLVCSMQVCTKWREVAESEQLWCWMLETEFEPHDFTAAKEGTLSYRECYAARATELLQKRRAQNRTEASTGGMRLLRNS